MRTILFFLAAALFAECPCPPIDTCAPNNPAYLPVSRRCQLSENCLENSNIYGSFDFLWWEGAQKGLEFASKNANSSFDQKVELYEPEFGFNPALRLAIGTHLSHDNWDLELGYTRYYTHTLNHARHGFAGNPNGGIRSIWTSAAAFQENQFRTLWQDAEAKWKIHANIFDFALKHRLCLSPALSLEPALGLKWALLQQRFGVFYQNGNTVSDIQGQMQIQFISSKVAMKNRSLNLGPSASVMTRWNLWDHFDFLGGLTAALFASRFSVGRNEFDVSLTNALQFDSIREGKTYWTLRPQAAAAFGIGWSDCVCRAKSEIYYGFSAFYEAQIYWKQNMLYRFIDQTNAAMIVPTQGDLFFHGLTLDGFIDF